jgi:DNA-binding NtrC family response regulator
LRVLEAREVRRLGAREPTPIDLRVIAATHRDLAAQINRGAFREDLYYRLAVVRVRVPPLRERREDIRPLVEHFVRAAVADAATADRVLRSIQPESWARLESHPWPGNVRELRNVIERSLALGGDGEPPDVDPARAPAGTPAELQVDLDRTFGDVKAEWTARVEEAYLLGQLQRHDGNVSRAARASGLERTHFRRVLRKYR